jgi:hypothetical protein
MKIQHLHHLSFPLKSKGTEMDKIALISCESTEQSQRLTVPPFVMSLESNVQNYDVDLDVNDVMVQNRSMDKLLKNLDSSPVFIHHTLLVCRERQHTTVLILEAFNIIKTASKDGMSVDTSNGVVYLLVQRKVRVSMKMKCLMNIIPSILIRS